MSFSIRSCNTFGKKKEKKENDESDFSYLFDEKSNTNGDDKKPAPKTGHAIHVVNTGGPIHPDLH